MKKYIILISIASLILLVVFQTACSRSAATPPASVSAGNPTATKSGPTSAPPTSSTQPISTQPVATSNPATATAPTTSSPASSDQLALTITSPADESVVDVSNVVITGQTAADAAVSVNGDIVDVDANGTFSLPVTLEEGPNVFDIIATDGAGDQTSAEIVVSYAPQA